MRNRISSWLSTLAMLAMAVPVFGAPPVPGRVEIQRIDIEPKIVIDPPRSRDFRVTLNVDKDRYYVGDYIHMTYKSNRDAQVFIFDTDTRGVTRQIFPNYYERDNSLRAGRTYHTPDPKYNMRISGPSGRETLRLVAYAKEYRVLRDWEDFSRSDPFPQRSLNPSRMLDQVGREYAERNKEDLRKGRSSVRPESIVIVPGQDFDYTETVVTFPVISSRYEDRYDDRGGYDYGRGHGTYPPDRGTTSLRISTDVIGADVYVDGYFYGTAPGTFSVSPGRHSVTVTDPAYGSRRSEVNVVYGSPNQLTVNLRR